MKSLSFLAGRTVGKELKVTEQIVHHSVNVVLAINPNYNQTIIVVSLYTNIPYPDGILAI